MSLTDMNDDQPTAPCPTPFDQLESGLIGLREAKDRLRRIMADLCTLRQCTTIGIVTGAAHLHMSFTGNPGTGKTAFAQKTADMLHGLGHLAISRVVPVSATELQGQQAGQSATRTAEWIKRARGGVLLIDEPYHLNRPETEHDYGREAIDLLTDTMSDRRNDLVIILAGDRSRMEELFKDAPRLRSQIAHHIHFPDYTQQELLDIAEHMLDNMHFQLDPAARAAFAEYLSHRVRQPHFANARSVRNALDRARLRQANRLFTQSLAGQQLDPTSLKRIEDADLLPLHISSAYENSPAHAHV